MTEAARDLWRAVRTRTAGRGAPGRPDPSASTLRVGVHAPDGTATVVDAFHARVRDRIAERMSFLGIPGDVVVTAAADGRPSRLLEISCEGRPLLVREERGPTAPRLSDAWVDDALNALELTLMQRGSLLLDATREAELTRDLIERAGDDRPGLYEGTVSRLLDLGLSVERLRRIDPAAGLHGLSTSAEIDETLIERTAPSAMYIEVSEHTLRNTDVRRDANALVEARRRIYQDTGLIYPDVDLAPTATPPGTVRVWLHDIPVTPPPLPETATWADVVSALEAVLRPHASWFVRSSTVSEQRRGLAPTVPELVELSCARDTDAAVAAVVRSMVGNRDSVRNLPRLLWLLLDAEPASTRSNTVLLAEPSDEDGGPSRSDPALVASGVRRRVHEEQRLGRSVEAEDTRAPLDPGVEERLLLGRGAEAFRDAEWELVRSLVTAPHVDTVVVRSPRALQTVRGTLSALVSPPRVVAVQELGPVGELP
jgi:hypothetical protein